VNIDNEPSKSGILPNELKEFRSQLNEIPEIQIAGLMCIPNPQRKNIAEPFQKLKALALPSEGLSMGMSDDYPSAIQSGSTHVRIGTALFGPRNRA
jgi:uncharacterized pyridoxal phosphate-containing UPF0001 family protein